MYKILMAIDINEARAINQAETVADLPQADDKIKVFIFHDFEENPEGASVGQIGSVRRAHEILDDHGIESELLESSGEPAETILETAEDIDADLICISCRKRTPVGKVLFGSTSQAVILNSTRPILIAELKE